MATTVHIGGSRPRVPAEVPLLVSEGPVLTPARFKMAVMKLWLVCLREQDHAIHQRSQAQHRQGSLAKFFAGIVR